MKKKTYYHYLPRNYFNNLYEKVSQKLVQGENVLVSSMVGCGGKTFLNLFLTLTKKDHLFKKILYFDPEIEDINLIEFVKMKTTNLSKQTLVIVNHFNETVEKRKTLEILNRLRQPHPQRLVYLAFTLHEGITKPQEYFAQTAIFFNLRVQIDPFTPKQTQEIIAINAKFYGWEINPKFYSQIYQLSGGIPRLVKHLCKEMAEKKITTESLDVFLATPSIFFQLDYFNSLLITLKQKQLQGLGLITVDNRIKSKLLELYFKRYKEVIAQKLYPSLTEQEAKIFSYLYKNSGEVVNLDKMGELLEMNDYDFSLWAIYKIISRLKPKIKENFEIKTLKGKGYLLTSLKH